LTAIQRQDVLRIIARIRELSCDPWPEGLHVRKLQHYGLADFRLRVGNYRVLFNRDDDRKEVRLLRVLHRSKLY
jgi:mRNA interferase RelE/StbE